MGAIRWGTRVTRPHTFSDSGIWYVMSPHIFLFRFRNVLVSHQAAPSHVTTKLRSWIELQLDNRKCAIRVVYKHPTPNYDLFSDEHFAIIDHLNNANFIYYICGDFNINLLKYFSQRSAANYVDTLQSLSCKDFWISQLDCLKLQPRSWIIFTQMITQVKLYLEYLCIIYQITCQYLLFSNQLSHVRLFMGRKLEI